MRSAIATPPTPSISAGPRARTPPTSTPGSGSSDALAGSAALDEPPTGLFGSTLEPILREQLDGRLSAVSWFRTDWQRGGALTGTATYRDDHGQTQDVVVKLPVPPRERDWLARCSASDTPGTTPGLTPHLYAHGDTVNGYDLVWVVLEKLPYGPVSPAKWGAAAFDHLLDAAADFHLAADAHPLPEPDTANATRNRLANDWAKLFDTARDQVKAKSFPNGQAWKKALKHQAKHFDELLARWLARPNTGWCHGDLHLGNALSRSPQATESKDAQIVLIDFACVRPGHWVEDAVYCEQLYWAHPQQLEGRKLASQLAKNRRARGLAVDDDWSRWADVLRTLYALTAPATATHHGGGGPYLDAALARLSH